MITVEKCKCDWSDCTDYWLVGIGSFVQGSGFTKEQAVLIASLLNEEEFTEQLEKLS